MHFSQHKIFTISIATMKEFEEEGFSCDYEITFIFIYRFFFVSLVGHFHYFSIKTTSYIHMSEG